MAGIDLSDLPTKTTNKPNTIDLSDIPSRGTPTINPNQETWGDTFKKYAPMVVRGASGFAPGGFIGAGVGGAGELLAETIEGRPNYNWGQVATQSALGAIPFGKAASLGRAALKGGLMGGAGTLATQQAETGLHVPTADELKNVGVGTTIGAVTGGVGSKLHERFGARESPKVEIPKSDAPVVDVPPGKVVKYATRKIVTEGGKTEEALAKEAADAIKFEGIDKTIYRRAQRTIDAIDGENASSKFDDPRKLITYARKLDNTIPKPKPQVKLAVAKEPEVTIPTDETPVPETPKTWFSKAASMVPRKEDGSINWNDVINSTKATSASGDLSAALHQGVFFAGRESWRKSLVPMLKALKKENYMQQMASIEKDPAFADAVTNGISFSKVGGGPTKGEEQFGSSLAEKLPLGIGKYVIAPSERAYTSFLNHLRLGMYKDLVGQAQKLGDPAQTSRASIANYINTGSGRGNMSWTIGPGSETGEKAATLLNNVFFSPRFIASRVQLLNPYTYYKLDPFLRKQAGRDIATLTRVAASVLGSAHLAGADVTIDPNSPDFGKIKVGNTRVDALGGFGQYIRFAFQLAKYGKGKVTGEDTGDSKANLGKLVKGKLSPSARLADEIVSGKDYFGKDTSVKKSVASAFTPLVAKDIIEAFKDDPKIGAMLAGPAIAGVPTQTYSNLGSSRKSSGGSMFGMPKLPKIKH